MILEFANLVLMTYLKFPTLILNFTGIDFRYIQTEDRRIAGRRFVKDVSCLAIEIRSIKSKLIVKERRKKLSPSDC